MSYFFIELNAVCVLVLLVLLLSMRRNILLLDGKLFCCMVMGTMGMLVMDAVSRTVEGQLFTGARELNIWSNCLYFVLTGLICYFFSLYADYKIREDFEAMKRQQWLFILPLALLILFALASPFTGWLYYIDEANVYHRGSFFWVQAAISWGMFLYATLFAFCCSQHEPYREKRTECFLISLFVVFPMLASILQTIFPNVSLTLVGGMFSLLIIFVNIQNEQIAMDALTKICNRGQLNRYLNAKISSTKHSRTLYLLLIDVDDFKSINDTCGHAAGDEALIHVADLLRQVCLKERRGDFLARYGGDEFAIVCERRNGESIRTILEAINEAVAQDAQTRDTPYTLSLSVGCALWRQEVDMSVDELITTADRRMYDNKQKKKCRLTT